MIIPPAVNDEVDAYDEGAQIWRSAVITVRTRAQASLSTPCSRGSLYVSGYQR
jgi:hypothetical protein